MSADVRFRPGNYGDMVSGKITGHEYFDYHLDARGGQKKFVELTVTKSNGNGTVYLNILPPGSSDVAIYNGSTDGNSTTVPLPKSGTAHANEERDRPLPSAARSPSPSCARQRSAWSRSASG